MRTLPQLTNTASLAGFILELALMVRTLVFTCVVIPTHAAGNAQLQQHCNQLAGFVNCFQVVKVSEVVCQEKAPMHQLSFSTRSRQVQGRCEQLLRVMVWLGTRLTQALLPGQFFVETGKPWSPHPLLRCNKMISTPAWLCVRSSLSAIGPDLQEQVTSKPPSEEAPLRFAKRLLLMGPQKETRRRR